jgi:hypothetical protein
MVAGQVGLEPTTTDYAAARSKLPATRQRLFATKSLTRWPTRLDAWQLHHCGRDRLLRESRYKWPVYGSARKDATRQNLWLISGVGARQLNNPTRKGAP